MRECFWLQRKSMWRSRMDGLAMKGLTEEKRNQKIKKGWCKLWKPADGKVPDQYNLIVAVNPLMS